jgi:predicted  nucleic acid-binding Zn-ribbon protein
MEQAMVVEPDKISEILNRLGAIEVKIGSIDTMISERKSLIDQNAASVIKTALDLNSLRSEVDAVKGRQDSLRSDILHLREISDARDKGLEERMLVHDSTLKDLKKAFDGMMEKVIRNSVITTICTSAITAAVVLIVTRGVAG